MFCLTEIRTFVDNAGVCKTYSVRRQTRMNDCRSVRYIGYSPAVNCRQSCLLGLLQVCVCRVFCVALPSTLLRPSRSHSATDRLSGLVSSLLPPLGLILRSESDHCSRSQLGTSSLMRGRACHASNVFAFVKYTCLNNYIFRWITNYNGTQAFTVYFKTSALSVEAL